MNKIKWVWETAAEGPFLLTNLKDYLAWEGMEMHHYNLLCEQLTEDISVFEFDGHPAISILDERASFLVGITDTHELILIKFFIDEEADLLKVKDLVDKEYMDVELNNSLSIHLEKAFVFAQATDSISDYTEENQDILNGFMKSKDLPEVTILEDEDSSGGGACIIALPSGRYGCGISPMKEDDGFSYQIIRVAHRG